MPALIDDPVGDRVRPRACIWLEDALGDVVVAAPVGGALGIGELVEVVAAGLRRQARGGVVDVGRMLDEVAAAAEALDRLDLGPAGAARHHRDEGQAEELGEIGLGDGGRAGGRLDQRGPRADAAVADAIEEERTRQPVLEAAGRMRDFVLEVDGDAAEPAEGGLEEMGVGRAASVALQEVDGVARPVPVASAGRGPSSGRRSGPEAVMRWFIPSVACRRILHRRRRLPSADRAPGQRGRRRAFLFRMRVE